jgi:hypothetical protein
MISSHSRRCALLLLINVAIASSRSITVPTPVSSTSFVRKNTETHKHKTLSDSFQKQQSQKQHHHIANTNIARGGVASIYPNIAELKGASIFIVLDHLFRKAFLKYGINFPSQLGGCCILLTLMLVGNVIKPGSGDAVFTALTPGAALLAKWLPVFFVPGLALLPLAPSMGSPVEVSFSLDIDIYI